MSVLHFLHKKNIDKNHNDNDKDSISNRTRMENISNPLHIPLLDITSKPDNLIISSNFRHDYVTNDNDEINSLYIPYSVLPDSTKTSNSPISARSDPLDMTNQNIPNTNMNENHTWDFKEIH